MIVGVGLDLADPGRIERALQRHPSLEARLFTPQERSVCRAASAPILSFAARFAAKEAALKALGTGWSRGIKWTDVEVLGGDREPPRLSITGKALECMRDLGAVRAHVSLSHEKSMAGAVVVLEGD
jgi:holo-[acyl-carrier protein] synthase